uniref:L1 transposable element RRM domain-containing protein n=1 Tax=Latimeria chalumnae TaxID=7897 RepID=H3B2I9_LATCH
LVYFGGKEESCSSCNSDSSSPRWENENGNGVLGGGLPADVKNILAMLNKMTDSLATLTNSVEELEVVNKDFLCHLNEVEQRTGAVEDELAEEKKRVAALDSKIAILAQRLDDQENRARRNNLRILGFPEQMEKGKPIQFLQEVLPKTLGLADGMQLELERAHRSLAPRPAAGQWPRPFIVRFLRFLVKEMVIRRARERGALDWEGNKILIFPDLSRELQEKRRKFMEVKKHLRDIGVKYGLFYPAILKVSMKGNDYSFNTPNEVQDFLKRLGGSVDGDPPSPQEDKI